MINLYGDKFIVCSVHMFGAQTASQKQCILISFEQATTLFHQHKVGITHSVTSLHTAKLNLISKLMQFENCQQG